MDDVLARRLRWSASGKVKAEQARLDREAADRIEEQAAELRTLRAERDRLQAMIDSRPAVNAGLPETYIKWSQAVYLAEAAQAVGVVQ